METTSDARSHVVIVLKTKEGGLWIRAQVEELLRRGFRVTMIVPSGPGKLKTHLSHTDVSFVDSPFNFEFSPKVATVAGLWRLRRLIKVLRPTVLFYHLYASALATRLATLFYRIPRVHMVAGPLYLESPLIARVEGFMRSMDTVLISGSDYTYREYEKLIGPRPRRHISIAYGVDSEKFNLRTEERAHIRSSLGMDNDKFIAVMVAYTYAPKKMLDQEVGVKGHELLLRAWREFHNQHSDKVVLYIVGSGFDAPGEEHRQKLIRQQVPGVKWIDTVSDVRKFYHTADVSVSPSISESHGAAMEAGACGCPQIVSSAGGLPEMVTEASGWIYPLSDVESLVKQLNRAYFEWQGGTLEARGLKAREHIASRYDAGLCASLVVDAIVSAEGGRRPLC